MSTVFRGVFSESLGGFLTVRGFAKLSDLAKLSIADIAYQRELKPAHQSDIEAFYRRAEYLFFPEVVLSLELAVDYDKPDAPVIEPWQAVRDGQGFRSNINGLESKACVVTFRKNAIRSLLPRIRGVSQQSCDDAAKRVCPDVCFCHARRFVKLPCGNSNYHRGE